MSLEPMNEIDRRVLGVLMEKAMAQPEYYPMTVNAVVAACNQKNNRDPMMELDDAAVDATLDELRKAGLVSVVLPAPGARTNRYRHEVAARFGWEKRVMAIMTELLLRGPQTPGELRGRCGRLTPFENVEAVMTALEYMQSAEPKLVKPLPRQPGQSAVRYTHLFYPPEEMAGIDAAAATAASGSPPSGGPTHPTTRAGQASMGASSAMGPSSATDSMRVEITELKDQVARLSADLTDLRQRFESLENQLK